MRSEDFMKSLILSITFLLFLFAISALAQQPPENLLEKTELTFYIEAEPTIADAGFNNPKSSWKIEYQLYLTDRAELTKIGRCGAGETEQEKKGCSHTVNQKPDKRIKKISVLLSKKKYKRNNLAADSNRKIVETVNFSPEVIETFNQAAKVYEKNPTFVLFVKVSVSTKNAAKAKLKKKYMTEGIHWLKIYNFEGKPFDYWNVSKLSFGSRVVKENDGSLRFGVGYTQVGLDIP